MGKKKKAKRTSQSQQLQRAIAFLRISIGVLMVWTSAVKLQDPLFHSRLPSVLEAWAANNPIFFYQDLLNWVIIPSAGLFSYLFTATQFLVGICLVLGLYTPIALMVQLFLSTNLLLAAQHSHPSVLYAHGFVLLICVTLLSANAGLCYGVDQWLSKRTSAPKKRSKSRSKVPRAKVKSFKPMIEDLTEDDEEDEEASVAHG